MSELKEHLFVPYSELQEGDELTDAITIAKSYYLKSEADKVIADKDKVIAGKDEEIRRLRRALWLQRVETAKTNIKYWRECLFDEPAATRAGIHGQRLIPPKTFKTIREWLTIWENVECKCRSKAKEYK